MKLIVNGQETDTPEGVTVSQLLQQRKLNPATVIVECNYEIIPKEDWDSLVLKEADQIEILAFVGGG